MTMQPWMLAALEEAGHTDTNTGLINRVAKYLEKSPNEAIDINEFRQACFACDIDSDSFSREDLETLQRKLK